MSQWDIGDGVAGWLTGPTTTCRPSQTSGCSLSFQAVRRLCGVEQPLVLSGCKAFHLYLLYIPRLPPPSLMDPPL